MTKLGPKIRGRNSPIQGKQASQHTIKPGRTECNRLRPSSRDNDKVRVPVLRSSSLARSRRRVSGRWQSTNEVSGRKERSKGYSPRNSLKAARSQQSSVGSQHGLQLATVAARPAVASVYRPRTWLLAWSRDLELSTCIQTGRQVRPHDYPTERHGCWPIRHHDPACPPSSTAVPPCSQGPALLWLRARGVHDSVCVSPLVLTYGACTPTSVVSASHHVCPSVGRQN